MDFIKWHFTYSLNYYFKSSKNSIQNIIDFFSPTILLTTLFSPWKRLVLSKRTAFLDLRGKLEVFSFNLISRLIGALIRCVILVLGISVIFISFFGSIFGFLIWVLFPFFSFTLYKRYLRKPNIYIQKLTSEFRKSPDPFSSLFKSEAGNFWLNHLGLNFESLEKNFEKTSFKIEEDAKSMKQIVEGIIKKNLIKETFLNKNGLSKKDMLLAASWWDEKLEEESAKEEGFFKGYPLALELSFGYTPTLDHYATELIPPSSFSHHLIGRKKVIEKIQEVFSIGKDVILVGHPGVGKKTVLLELAKRSREKKLIKELCFKRLFELDYNFLLSESYDLNYKKKLLATIFEEAESAGNVILVLKDIQRLTNPQFEGYDFTDIFEKYLEKKNFKLIAISTLSDYERFISPSIRLKKYLEKVEVEPPDKEEALEILIQAAKNWERKTSLIITIPALRKIIEGSDEFITEIPFPEKALELLDYMVSLGQKNNLKILGLNEAKLILSEKTGISFLSLSKSEEGRLKKLEEIIHQRLINQDDAVNLIAKILRAKTTQVVSEKKPIGSFLFLGPTGVGKTETAKVLARVYFGSEKSIIRFDMAEYSGEEGLERLIGSISKNLPGELTSQIKNKPFSLLLLDEIEKAPRQIYNLFLTLLDEGYIKDAFGKKIIGRNLFIIGTSNAGASFVKELVEKGIRGEGLQEKVIDFCIKNQIFSPEFLNRFDGVVVFQPLKTDDVIKIAQLMLSDLQENLYKKNIYFTPTLSLAKKIASESFSPSFGARPMKRLINLELGDLIAKSILSGKIAEGDKIEILPGSAKGEFIIKKL